MTTSLSMIVSRARIARQDPILFPDGSVGLPAYTSRARCAAWRRGALASKGASGRAPLSDTAVTRTMLAGRPVLFFACRNCYTASRALWLQFRKLRQFPTFGACSGRPSSWGDRPIFWPSERDWRARGDWACTRTLKSDSTLCALLVRGLRGISSHASIVTTLVV